MTKTVIVIWKQVIMNHTGSYWGFGDMLRGVCGVAEVCKEYGYNLFVDMRYHPVHHFFKHIEHGYESVIDNNINNVTLDIFNTHESLVSKLSRAFEASDVYYNAMWCDTYVFNRDLSSSTKEFVRRLLTPTDDFREYIDSRLPSTTFHIVHFRLGDDRIGTSALTDYEQYQKLIERYACDGDFIISDNKRLKEIVRDTYSDKYRLTDIEPCHIGKETELEKIRGTLYEFILTSRAMRINTKSCYSWISGFVNTVHSIFDVPITYMS